MPDITVEVTQSDITANVTSPNITANVTSADVAANVTTTDVTANVEAANVTVNITGGGSPHIIQDEGVAETQRANLNFVGAGVSVSDDSANNATVVTISGGGGGGTWGGITGTLSDQTDLQTALDGKVDENAAITGATKTKITYDAKGLVTAGADAAIADISGLQTALDGKSDTGHTHPLSDITQSGATTNQVPKWNGSAWVPANDAGGGASVTEITYSDMQTAITNGTLTPGAWYLITDAAGTDLGFLTNAINENTINVSGVGGYLNADFQAVGDYSGTPETFGTQLGIWRTGFEQITINYLNLTGGTFAAGDTITGGTTGATAVVVSDDGAASMTAYMTSAGIAFDGLEVLDNGAGVTADMDGAASSPTIVQGDVVIWNLTHYQLTDATLLDGTNPATNTAAYTALAKGDYPEPYVTAWDVSEYDFPNDSIQYRQDLRGGLVRGAAGIAGYQFGRDACTGNNIQSPDTFDIRNLVASFNNNTTFPGATVSEIATGTDTLIENNILENGGQLTGITAGESCSIRGNTVGQGATLGGGTTMYNNTRIEANTLYSDTSLSSNILEFGAYIAGNTLLPSSEIFGNAIGEYSVISGNELSGNSYIDGNELGSGAFIQNNKLDPEASIDSCIVENGAYIRTNRVARQLNNKTVSVGVEFSKNEIGLSASRIETITVDVKDNIIQSGLSSAFGTIDITGLTTLDCTAAFAQYRGIFNLTSTNATEAIDTITNPPTAFPFTIRPAAGLSLTITGTAYAGIAAEQIALKATDYTLDGDKGEYIVLEIDPLGTGALIEKQVVNGLL